MSPIVGRAESEDHALRSLSFLEESHGFQSPKVCLTTWGTMIQFLRNDLGLELVIDWRDGVVMVLVVAIKDGVVAAGREGRLSKERIELVNLICDLRLRVEGEEFVPPPFPRRRRLDPYDFDVQTDYYASLLRGHLPFLLANTHRCFED